MNISLKKVISSFLAMSLGVASIGSTALITSAEDTTSQGKGFSARDATVRELTVDFMGRETPTATSPPEGARLQAQDVNHTFWVGVAVNNADSLPLFKEGVFSIELSFEYDPDFLVPDSWDTKLSPANIQAGAAVDNQLLWSDLYRIISVEKTDIDYTENRENKELGATRHNDGWKMCTVCITKDNSAGDRRFQNLTSADKQYLIRLPFILKRVPADTEDQNPIVLSLIRGPGTLDIGSGINGENEHSASWEALSSTPTQEELDDQTNLRNLFSYPKDISLFGSASELENLVVSKTELKEGEDPVDYTLSKIKNDEKEEGFETATKEYYLSVPYETEKIKLTMISSEKPQVSNGSPITVTSGENAKEYVTDAITLDTIDKTVEEYGYNNVITITVGTNEYKIHVRRYLQPKIELEYGNSPIAEIKKGVNTENIDNVIADFISTNSFSGIDNSILSGVKRKSTYTPEAWVGEYDLASMSDEEIEAINQKIADPNINMDRNDFAIFAYNTSPFRDTGFTIIDSFGDVITDEAKIKENLVRKITVQTMSEASIAAFTGTYTSKPILITGKESKYLFTEITPENESVVPAVYTMEYEYTDEYNQKAKAERPIIILWGLGDADMTAQVNVSDPGAVYSVVNGKVKLITSDMSEDEKNFREKIRNLFLFRIVDADTSGQVNVSDPGAVYSVVNKKLDEKIYNELD